MAFVVLIDGPKTAAFWLDGATCLDALAAVARFVEANIKIAMTFGLTEAKWTGRGLR